MPERPGRNYSSIRSRIYAMTSRLPSFILLLAVFALSACAPRASQPVLSPDSQAAAIELDSVPFYPQEQYQCGPAALATVLDWSGLAITPERLAPALMIPARQGSLQIELQAQTRAHGRVPFALRGDLRALQAELAAGHPVLVLQNLAFDWRPVWHYAVVVGMDPVARTVTLRSGRERRHVVSWTTFQRTWARARHWGLVILEPGRLPASAEPAQVLSAAAAFDEKRVWSSAEKIYRSAQQRWPRQIIFALGTANSRYAQGDLHGAEQVYRKVIAEFPDDPVGYNNLSLVLADLERWNEAERMAAQAVRIGGPLRAEFLDTQRRIAQRLHKGNAD